MGAQITRHLHLGTFLVPPSSKILLRQATTYSQPELFVNFTLNRSWLYCCLYSIYKLMRSHSLSIGSRPNSWGKGLVEHLRPLNVMAQVNRHMHLRHLPSTIRQAESPPPGHHFRTRTVCKAYTQRVLAVLLPS